MEYTFEPRKVCQCCGKELPIDMFEILAVHETDRKFSMLAKGSFTINERSYTCKNCGPTTLSEWIKRWKQNS